MFQHHVLQGLNQLVIAVVESIVADQSERITLIHVHMSESFKGICLFKEIGAIAIQVSSIMQKVNVSPQYLSIVVAPLVVKQFIGMNQVHPFRILLLFRRLLTLLFRITFLLDGLGSIKQRST